MSSERTLSRSRARFRGGVWLRRLLSAFGVALALGYVPYHLYARSGLARYLRLEEERDALHATNLRTRQSIVRLRADLAAFQGDDLSCAEEPGCESGCARGAGCDDGAQAAIERVARDELGLVKPGEIVFQIEPAE